MLLRRVPHVSEGRPSHFSPTRREGNLGAARGIRTRATHAVATFSLYPSLSESSRGDENMSNAKLPSLSMVLKGLLPGSPPYRGGSQRDLAPTAAASSSSSAKAAAAGAGSAPGAPMSRPPFQQELALTPVSASQRSDTSGGYRRRRDEMDLMNEMESPGGSVFSDSCSTATYGGGGGGGWGGSSWDGSDHEGGGPASSDHGERHGMGVPASSGGVSGGGGGIGGGGAYGIGCTSKRAKLTQRSLSRLSDESNGTGIMGGSDIGGMVGSGSHARAALMGRKLSAGSIEGLHRRRFEQSASHSTEEWQAMSKAGRVLGVDSLEERDVEEQRRRTSDKAARYFGVGIEELPQQTAHNAARDRHKWAPPRSSASKAARMFSVASAADPDDGEGDAGAGAGRRGRKPTTKSSRRLVRSRSLQDRRSGGGAWSSVSKTRQGSISSLIRALEINGDSDAGTSQNGSSDNGSEDILPKKGTGGGGARQETGSNRSTRATESCSSVSDLAPTDPDGISNHGGSSSGGGAAASAANGQLQADHHQQQKQQHQQHQHIR